MARKEPDVSVKHNMMDIANHGEIWMKKGRRPGSVIDMMSHFGLISDGNNADVTSVTRQDRSGQETEIEVRSYPFRHPVTRAQQTAHFPEPAVFRQIIVGR